MSKAVSKVAITTAVAASITFGVSLLVGGVSALFGAEFVQVFCGVGTFLGFGCGVATVFGGDDFDGKQRVGLALSSAIALGTYGATAYNELDKEYSKPSIATISFNSASCKDKKVEVSPDKSKIIVKMPPGCYAHMETKR